MLDYAPVTVSGRGTNAEFIIDDSMSFADTSKALQGYLIEHRGLWSGGEIILTVGTRFFSGEQLYEFKKIIENESGLRVVRFSCVPDTIAESHGGQGTQYPNLLLHNAVLPSTPDNAHISGNTPFKSDAVAVELPVGPEKSTLELERKPVNPPSKARTARTQAKTKQSNHSKGNLEAALLVKSTCRSGEIINHDGDVVVLGDVNPGAEVLAEGDIIVVGCLRGYAHAGSNGYTEATIVALSLGSPRIQIGPHVGVFADAGPLTNDMETVPVIAYVRGRSIHLAAFEGRFANYGRGELYDG